MGKLAEFGNVQASVLLARIFGKGWNLLIGAIGLVSIGIGTLLHIGNNSGIDLLKSPLKPVHLVGWLVLINEVFREWVFGVGISGEVDKSDTGKLFLPALTEMSGGRVAGVLLEVADIFLVVLDDHLFL